MRNIWLILFVFCGWTMRAQIPAKPQTEKLYNNFSKEFPGFLNPSEAASLEAKLEEFKMSTSNQICVVVTDDLNGMDAGQYATAIGNTWGVGTADFKNGVVIVVKPTESDGGRDLAIATGYGLEGAIPDLLTKRVREEMTPYLQQGQYFQALDHGTNMLMSMAKGEYSREDRPAHGKKSKPLPWYMIVLGIVFFLFFSGMFRKRGYTYSRGGRSIWWGGGLGGGLGGFGGRGFGGGSSGGGWGGFGGGSFGGGGSSGKW